MVLGETHHFRVRNPPSYRWLLGPGERFTGAILMKRSCYENSPKKQWVTVMWMVLVQGIGFDKSRAFGHITGFFDCS